MKVMAVRTSYLGFVVIVDHQGFTVLDRDGRPLGRLKSMRQARAFITALRRAEKDVA